MLSHYGISLSEPMIFGSGSGIFFIHIPFLKVNGVPATSYRIWPGAIFNRSMKLLEPRWLQKNSNLPRNP